MINKKAMFMDFIVVLKIVFLQGKQVLRYCFNFYFFIFSVFMCIMDYYRNLPNYSIENEEFYEIEKSKVNF